LHDGSIRGLIGFSGTAEAYRPRFAALGMHLAYSIPLDTLIGYGFVAPFAELGVPFANSARERRIRDLLDAYKTHLLGYVRLLGADRLRGWFAEIPLEERVAIGRTSLRMYRGRVDAAEATAKRMREIGLRSRPSSTSSRSLTAGQISVARRAGVGALEFDTLREAVERIRADLAELIYLPSTVARLRLTGFTTEFKGVLIPRSVRPMHSAGRLWDSIGL
jgi:hypothetical protein